MKNATGLTVKTSYRNGKPRKGLRRVSHLTSAFKGPLLRMDCKDRSRETGQEATAVIQVRE